MVERVLAGSLMLATAVTGKFSMLALAVLYLSVVTTWLWLLARVFAWLFLGSVKLFG